MKRFLSLGIIGVLVAGISLFGIEEFRNKKVKNLEAKVFQAKTYIKHGDLVNAKLMLNIIREENLNIQDKSVKEDIAEIESSIKSNKESSNYDNMKNLDELTSKEREMQLLNIYLENHEFSPKVKSIESFGVDYYKKFRKDKNLPIDEDRDFKDKKGYILKPIKLSKRFSEDICLIFDSERPYYINNNIYYKFIEIPVSSYFGEGEEEIWYFADLNFNIISKENLEFYMDNNYIIDYKNRVLNNYNLSNYIREL